MRRTEQIWRQMMSVALLMLTTTALMYGQPLKRKAYLGAHLTELSAIDQPVKTDFGLYLNEIFPDGSLAQLGVPSGTVLQKINDAEIKTMQDLNPALAPLRAGDELSIQVFEHNQSKIYRGTAMARPKEQHAFANVDYGAVHYKDNVLRSLLYMPTNVVKPPVVFFIQGYTCQSIEMPDNNPAKQLINSWLKAGYAVYLVEKPGMGDSDCKIPCMDIDFNQELEAFSQAYSALRQNNKIDAEHIFLFGHSMGGVIAPLLAERHTPAGIMVFGVVGENWYDYMTKIYTEQPRMFGTSQEQIDEDAQYYLPFVKDLLIHKKSNEELIANSLYGDRLRQDGTAESLARGYYIMRHYRYWQTLADVDIPDAWAKVKSPVYVLHGEYDIQAIHPKYGEMIVTQVLQHGGTAKFELFPKTEHAFLRFDSREELLATMRNGSYVSSFTTHFNPDIAVRSLEWMKQQVK